MMAEAPEEDLLPFGLGNETRAEQPDFFEFLSKAKSVLNRRRLRSRFFNRAIFGEPAWEILLVLYISDVSGGRQTIGKLADWIDTPLTTALRWIAYLEKERLVERQAHPQDKRVVFLRLLDKGRNSMEAYLSSLQSSLCGEASEPASIGSTSEKAANPHR